MVLFNVASAGKTGGNLRLALKKVAAGSVGPVCTEVLQRYGVQPDIVPEHPRMGSLLGQAAASARGILAARRRVAS